MPALDLIYPIVVRHLGKEVLVEAESRSLPSLRLSLGAGFAHDVADSFQRIYGVDICILFSFNSPKIENYVDTDDLTWTPITGTDMQIVVAQPWFDDLPQGARLVWAPVSAVTGDDHTMQSVLQALQFLWDRIIGRVKEPFGRLEWFRNLIAFNGSGGKATSRPRLKHWGGNETAAVIRMEINEDCFWLKATAGVWPDTLMKLVRLLSSLSVPYIPATLGYLQSSRAQWDGLAQENIEGLTLRNSNLELDWLETARRMAEIQIATIGHTALLIESGCGDWSWKRIQCGSQQLFRWLRSEVFAQEDLLGTVAHRSNLSSVGKQVQAVLDGSVGSTIPSTLIRCYFSPNDVVVHRSRGPHFVTWSACTVSNPFVWFYYLAEAAMRNDGGCPESFSALCEAYLDPWSTVLGIETAKRGLEDASCIAALLEALRVARIDGMDSGGNHAEDLLPAERQEWAWELTQDTARLSVLQRSLRIIVSYAMDREIVS